MNMQQYQQEKSASPDNVWSVVVDKKQVAFTAEMSDLKANNMLLQNGMLVGPTGKQVSFAIFDAQVDREGDVTCWVYRQGCYTYTIFND